MGRAELGASALGNWGPKLSNIAELTPKGRLPKRPHQVLRPVTLIPFQSREEAPRDGGDGSSGSWGEDTSSACSQLCFGASKTDGPREYCWEQFLSTTRCGPQPPPQNKSKAKQNYSHMYLGVSPCLTSPSLINPITTQTYLFTSKKASE